MVLKVTKPTGKAVVTKETKKTGQTVSTDTHNEEVETGDGPVEVDSNGVTSAPCVVEVGMGFTKNMGDYESARLDVRIAIPCRHDEINDVYDTAKEWVEQRLQALVDEIS